MEDHSGVEAPRGVEAMDRAEQVGVNQVAVIPFVARLDRRLGRALDEPIDGAGGFDISGLPDVTVAEEDAAVSQARQCELAAATFEVVEGDYLGVFACTLEGQSQRRAHEARAPRHQNPFAHASTSLRALEARSVDDVVFFASSADRGSDPSHLPTRLLSIAARVSIIRRGGSNRVLSCACGKGLPGSAKRLRADLRRSLGL